MVKAHLPCSSTGCCSKSWKSSSWRFPKSLAPNDSNRKQAIATNKKIVHLLVGCVYSREVWFNYANVVGISSLQSQLISSSIGGSARGKRWPNHARKALILWSCPWLDVFGYKEMIEFLGQVVCLLPPVLSIWCRTKLLSWSSLVGRRKFLSWSSLVGKQSIMLFWVRCWSWHHLYLNSCFFYINTTRVSTILQKNVVRVFCTGK
jgi:hypothetical protein